VGLDLSGAWRPYLRAVEVAGPFGPGVGTDFTDASPQYVGTAAVVLDDSYDWTIDNCHFWAYHTILRDRGNQAEAGRLVDTVLANGRVGLDRYRPDPEPVMWIDNCHFNNRDINLSIEGAKLVVIRGCHPFNQDTTNQYTGTSTDIYLKDVDRTVIANCAFHYDGAADRINIDVAATGTGTTSGTVVIEGNIFGALAARAVRIGTGCTAALIMGNAYPGTVTQRIEDNSGAATILDREGGGEMRLAWQWNGGAIAGPNLRLHRESTAPAAQDKLGGARFFGRDSAGTLTEYATIQSVLVDPTDGSEDGEIDLYAQVAGTLTKVAAFLAAAPVNTTSMFLLVNNGTTSALQRVAVGAADSGGTGYRMLRVVN
jgi:hypothetical protein